MTSNTLADDLLGHDDDDTRQLDTTDTAPEPVSEPSAQDEPERRRRLPFRITIERDHADRPARRSRRSLDHSIKLNVLPWKDGHHVGLRANWSKFISGIALVAFGILFGRSFQSTDSFGYSLGMFLFLTALIWAAAALIIVWRAGFLPSGKIVIVAIIALLVVLGYLKIEAVNNHFISAWGIFVFIITQALLAANTLTSWWHPHKESRNFNK